MYLVEIEGHFEDKDEALAIVEEVLNRLIIDEETGEIIGMLEDEDFFSEGDELTVDVPDHVINWAKKEATAV